MVHAAEYNNNNVNNIFQSRGSQAAGSKGVCGGTDHCYWAVRHRKTHRQPTQLRLHSAHLLILTIIII
jgi:hypothetical protein